tara:strand:+ start:1038 stop:1463 length:426 start_codon:yes stop_codon:yes gene_type:complete
MKKLLIFSFAILFAACQPSGEKAHNHDSNDHSDHKDHLEENTSVALNNGERWEANPETNEGIQKMINLVADFDQQNGDYATLQTSLQTDFRDIFRKCTMTGEAHEQLHNYLLPLKEKLEKVSPENIKEILSYLHTYKNYFE